MQAVEGLGTGSGLRVVLFPAVRPTAGDHFPDAFPVASRESGPPPAGVTRVARSPLVPTAAYYAEAFGWPIAMDTGDIVLICGRNVDALSMPVGLAGEVNHLLMVNRMYAPVIELRDDERPTWAFLCKPRECTRPVESLAHHGVKHFGKGTRVLLPLSAGCASGSPRWVTQPRRDADDALPPWMAVFSCATKAIRR